MDEDQVRAIVRDEINKYFTGLADCIPASAIEGLGEMIGAPDEAFLKIWNALFGIGGEEAA